MIFIFHSSFQPLSIPGDWHTAYLLLYGPRRLPKYEEKEEEEDKPDAAAKADNNGSATAAAAEKMETS